MKRTKVLQPFRELANNLAKTRVFEGTTIDRLRDFGKA